MATGGHGGARRNRLAEEASPYLQLHAHNPVDWYPWGPEAIALARREDRPIFLSIGYSTCYWCHVMERESFSDPDIARAINEGFVAIKVDREERPDIDLVFMAATQLMTRSGGWPNSVFLTPDLKPFFAATYLPPRDAPGRPGLPRVLGALREAWGLRRGEVRAQASAVAEALRAHLQVTSRESGELPGVGIADEAMSALSARFDQTHGGFGRAPKFPSPPTLLFVLDRINGGDRDAGPMLELTLSAMAAGGIRDHLAGGFHRYSTDERWLVPHFEKMLYDNVALAELYAEAHGLFPSRGFDAVARDTLGFVLREMAGPDGELYSAIDAETDGHEGAYYVWDAEELLAVLGAQDLELLAPLLGVDGDPTFEGSHYVLHQSQGLSEWAATSGAREADLAERLASARARLLSVRAKRKRPLLDDKVLADWNGLGIAALARAGAVLAEPEFLEAARRAASFVLGRMRGPDGLTHVAREGRSWVAALLDDYAFVVRGLLDLHGATHEPRWLEAAVELAHEQEARLTDAETGGYYTAPDDATLWLRPRQSHDGATVSGSGVSALNLLDLAAQTGETAWLVRAERLLRAHGEGVRAQPVAHLTLVRAATRFLDVAEVPGAVAQAASGPTPSASEELEDEAREVVDIVATLETGPGEWRGFTLELSIRRGWHLYSAEQSDGAVVPTAVRPVLGRLRGLRYPEGSTGGSAALPVGYYRDRVVIRGEIEPPASGAPSVALAYQACDDERCLPPITRVVRIS